jgi:hypothetical protein
MEFLVTAWNVLTQADHIHAQNSDLNTKKDLIPTLQAMGMTITLYEGMADFSKCPPREVFYWSCKTKN